MKKYKRRNGWVVVLVIHDREDVRDDWKVTEKILYRAKNRDEALWWCRNHSYLETDIDPNDFGDHWLHIEDLDIREATNDERKSKRRRN